MESKLYSFRELLSGCKNSNYMHEYVLYFKLCAVGTLFRKGRILMADCTRNSKDGHRKQTKYCLIMSEKYTYG